MVKAPVVRGPHSSSSSKFPKLWFVTRSSTVPFLESTPLATCQPVGNPGSSQPCQAAALCCSNSECQRGAAALAGKTTAESSAKQLTTRIALFDRVLFTVHPGPGNSIIAGPVP